MQGIVVDMGVDRGGGKTPVSEQLTEVGRPAPSMTPCEARGV